MAKRPVHLLAYDRKTAEAFARLQKLGVIKLTPSAAGTRVDVTRDGWKWLSPSQPIRHNPTTRADLARLRAHVRAACANVNQVHAESREVFRDEAKAARARRETAKQKAKAEIETARAARDKARAKARGACNAAKGARREAAPKKKPRPSKGKSAKERAQLLDAEAERTLTPSEWWAWQGTGGGRHWMRQASERRSALEAFRHFAEEEGTRIHDFAPNFSGHDFSAEEAEYYRRQMSAA